MRAPDGRAARATTWTARARASPAARACVSTARDYARFLQMILNGGVLDGVGFSPKTVDLMTTNQTDTLKSTPGHVRSRLPDGGEAPARTACASVGTFGWGGAYASNIQGGPLGRKKLVIVFMINQL